MPHKKSKRSIREKTRLEQGSDLAPTNLKTPLQNEPIPKSAHRILNAMSIREDFKKRKAGEDVGQEGVKRRKGDNDGKEVKRDANGNENKDKKGKGKASATKSVLETMKILPGESIQHFNRRVEDDLRPLVKTAVQASRAAVRNAVKEEKEAKAQAKKEREEKAKAKSKSKHGDSGSESENDDDDGHSSKSKTKTSKAKNSTHTSTPTEQVDKHASKAKEFATISSSAPKRLNDIAMAPPEFKKLPRGASKGGVGSTVGTAMGRGDGVLSMAQKLMMEKEREKVILRYRELKASRMKESRERDVDE